MMKSKFIKEGQQQPRRLKNNKVLGGDQYYTMDRMTDREREVFVLIKKGLTSKECATALKISVRTVEIHRANIIHKYQVKNIVELVYRIKKYRLIKNKQLH